MKVVQPSVTIINASEYWEMLDTIEKAGRTCYKSEPGNSEEFVKGLIKRGHLSVLEHCSITIRIVCDRGVSHELVRHRLASYSQESTRYCNYSKERFNNEITVINPSALSLNQNAFLHWEWGCKCAEKAYFQMLASGCTPQDARSVLPNSLKTEVVMTANIREWIHFLELRCDRAAHPQMRQIAMLILDMFAENYPVLFNREDILNYGS